MNLGRQPRRPRMKTAARFRAAAEPIAERIANDYSEPVIARAFLRALAE